MRIYRSTDLKAAKFYAIDVETTGLDFENDFSLDSMIASYGLKQYYRHNAAADTFFAAQIFQIQMREMTALGIDSAEKVIKAAKSRRHAEPCLAF